MKLTRLNFRHLFRHLFALPSKSPSKWLSLSVSIKRLAQYDRPLMTFLPRLNRFTDSTGLTGAGQNKQPWQQLTVSGLCMRLTWPHLCRSREKLNKTARKPVANGFLTGQSLPATRKKTRGAAKELPLGNVRLHLLTRLWRHVLPLMENKMVVVMSDLTKSGLKWSGHQAFCSVV